MPSSGELAREVGRNQRRPTGALRAWHFIHLFLSRNSARLPYRLGIARSETVGKPIETNVETTEISRFCGDFAALRKDSEDSLL